MISGEMRGLFSLKYLKYERQHLHNQLAIKFIIVQIFRNSSPNTSDKIPTNIIRIKWKNNIHSRKFRNKRRT